MSTYALARDLSNPEPAGCFRQEPATAGPGLPVTTNTAMKGNPMVEPTTPVVTFTVPGELHARAEAAYDAYAQAVSLVADELTAAHARALSAARTELASVYRELASTLTRSRVLFLALDHMAAQQFNDALDDDRWAKRLDASTFGGDVE